MPSFRASSLFRLAAAAALVAALGLAGCGRKGPLDPPPGANLEGVPQATSDLASSNGRPAISGQSIDSETNVGPDGRPLAPKGPKRTFILDGLLN